MGAKANKEISAARVDRCVELISLCKSTSEIIRIGKVEWGLRERQIEEYIYKARTKIREKYDAMDRQDWVASALERLDRVATMSLECRQHSNAIGAIGLQAKLLQLTPGNN